MKPLLKVGLLLVLFLFGCTGEKKFIELTSLRVLFKDQAARGLLKLEKYEEALELYISMLEDEPDQARIHSNIAVLLSQTQKPEEALKSLEHALKIAKEKNDILTEFAIQFNLGVFYGAQKKIPEALKNYQAALEIVPTSKETKTNIELLIQNENKNGKGNDNKDNKENQSNDQKNQQNNNENGQDKKDNQKDQKDGKNDNEKDDEKEKQRQEENKPQKRESSAKYKPRPFQGEQLSEGDVKKILGELKNQEQKIRANFDKKEKKDSSHEKDW
jgi:Ca-activated chloride channel homolog